MRAYRIALFFLLPLSALRGETFFYEDFSTDPVAAGRMEFFDPTGRAQQETSDGNWELTLPAGNPNFDTWCGFDRCPRLRIEAPEGDFSFEAKTALVSAPNNYHGGLFVEFEDNDPGHFFMYGFYNGNRLRFEQCVGPKEGPGVPAPPVTADLRIEKEGTLYTFSYRLEGNDEWITTTDEYPWTGEVRYIGLFAKNWSSNPQVVMKFDDFLVRVPQPAPPEIKGPPDGFAVVGSEYTAALILIPGYPERGEISLAEAPEGLFLDETNLKVYWTPDIPDLDELYTIRVKAENSAGYTEAAWRVRVLPTPPLAVMEAESGETVGDMRLLEDDAASEGVSVEVPSTAEEHLRNPAPEEGSAAYAFSVEWTCDYCLWIRGYTESASSDTVWIRIDDEEPLVFTFDLPIPPEYAWSRLTDQGGGAPLHIPLSSGEHTLQVSVRESNLKFDKILFVADDDYVPYGLGPGGSENLPPTARIELIPDSSPVYLFAGAASVILDGSSSWDDGLPEALSFRWRKTSGPDSFEFDPPEADLEKIRITFSGAGDYVFELTVSDGGATDSAEIAITVLSPSGGLFRRGDTNGDGRVDIADAVAALNALFGESEIRCPDAADANDDGKINIADPVTVLDLLFGTGLPLPPPGESNCGADPTADDLGACDQEACS